MTFLATTTLTLTDFTRRSCDEASGAWDSSYAYEVRTSKWLPGVTPSASAQNEPFRLVGIPSYYVLRIRIDCKPDRAAATSECGRVEVETAIVTGNLESDRGRRFGYQLTIFRSGLEPEGARTARASAWATSEVWLGHFAITDVEGNAMRGALGLAGATGAPFRVWLEDWEFAAASEGDSIFPLRVRATHRDAEGSHGIDLRLRT